MSVWVTEQDEQEVRAMVYTRSGPGFEDPDPEARIDRILSHMERVQERMHVIRETVIETWFEVSPRFTPYDDSHQRTDKKITDHLECVYYILSEHVSMEDIREFVRGLVSVDDAVRTLQRTRNGRPGLEKEEAWGCVQDLMERGQLKTQRVINGIVVVSLPEIRGILRAERKRDV